MSRSAVYEAGDNTTQGQCALKQLGRPTGLVEDDIITMNGRLDPGVIKVIPITERLLASLIVEDEDMIGGDFEGRNSSFQHSGDNHTSCLPVNGNLTDNNYSIECDYHFVSGPQNPDQLGIESSCNGVMRKNVCSQSNCDIYPDGYVELHSERVCTDVTENGYTCDEQYKIQRRALLELHSIGLHPENVVSVLGT